MPPQSVFGSLLPPPLASVMDMEAPPGLPVAAPVTGSAVPAIPANNTIYINNLAEKIKEVELKRVLTDIFKQFGKVRLGIFTAATRPMNDSTRHM